MSTEYFYRIEGNNKIGFKAQVFIDMSANHVEPFTIISEATQEPFHAATLPELMETLKKEGYA